MEHHRKQNLHIDAEKWDDSYQLLSRLKTSLYLRKRCEEFIYLTARMKAHEKRIDAAEIGVGYGASAVEVCMQLDEGDSYSCFDFSERTDALLSDLKKAGVKCSLHGYGNTHKTFDSYCWSLSKLVFEMRRAGKNGLYDLVFLDGSHDFTMDTAACVLLKELLKPGGYIILDDVYWSFGNSPDRNPEADPTVSELYTQEQIDDIHLLRVVNLLMINDPAFEKVENSFFYDPPEVFPPRMLFRKK